MGRIIEFPRERRPQARRGSAAILSAYAQADELRRLQARFFWRCAGVSTVVIALVQLLATR